MNLRPLGYEQNGHGVSRSSLVTLISAFPQVRGSVRKFPGRVLIVWSTAGQRASLANLVGRQRLLTDVWASRVGSRRSIMVRGHPRSAAIGGGQSDDEEVRVGVQPTTGTGLTATPRARAVATADDLCAERRFWTPPPGQSLDLRLTWLGLSGNGDLHCRGRLLPVSLPTL